MKISTIIPAYNAAKTLTRCVESISRQGIDMNEMECIIVNDGSTDNTSEVCEKLRNQYSNIIRVIEQENKGVCAARNAGIGVAKGEYIHFLDADDYLADNLYNEILKYDTPELDYLGFWSITIDRYVEEKELPKTVNQSNVVYRGYYIDYYKDNHYLTFVWNGLYRLHYLQTNNIMFKTGIRVGEDVLFNLDFSMNNPLLLVTDCVGLRYVTHPGQVTKNRDPKLMKQISKEYVDIISKIVGLGKFYPEITEHLRRYATSQLSPCLTRALSSNMTTKEFKGICEKLVNLGLLTTSNNYNKDLFICRFILRNAWLFPLYKILMKGLFLPFILPRLSRN